jgi:lactoylglutathione lyase
MPTKINCWGLMLGLALQAVLFAAEPPPITGIANIGIRVTDLDQALAYYTGVLGYQIAFRTKDAAQRITGVYLKVNDTQFIEIQPGLAADQHDRVTHVAFVTPDIKKLHQILRQRGLAENKIERDPDGNFHFDVNDPDGHRLEFVEYQPGSWQSKTRGKFMDSRRVSDHILHAGLSIANGETALAFYRDKLGLAEFWRWGPSATDIRYFNLRIPGSRGDYVELMPYSAAATPQQVGSSLHVCFEVPEVQPAREKLVSQGLKEEERNILRVGRNRHRLFNTFDPNGTRTEWMEPRETTP